MTFPRGSMILISSSQGPNCYTSSTQVTTQCVYSLYNNNDYLEGIQTIQINNVCLNQCSNVLSVKVSNFYSPLNNQPISTSQQMYNVKTFTVLGYAISAGSLSVLTSSGNMNTLTPMNLNALPQISSLSQIVNSPSTLTLSFSLNYPWPPLNHLVYPSKLQIQLPLSTSQLQLTSSTVCLVTGLSAIQFFCNANLQGLVTIYYNSA